MATTDTKGRQTEYMAVMMSLMRQFEWDMLHKVTVRERLPKEWTEIWQGRSKRRSRVTIRVDDDVLRFFKAMGSGHGPRMNAVLRTFMAAQLAGLIEDEKLPQAYRESWMGKPRPNLRVQMAEVYAEAGRDPDGEM